MISDKGLLFIEPSKPASPEPNLDRLTRKMAAAFHRGRTTICYGGFHECFCGAWSTTCDYRLPNGEATNSLCVHYVAHHRSEIPLDQMARIEALAFGEAEPDALELQSPKLVLRRILASVVNSLGVERLTTWTYWGLDIDSLFENLRGGYLSALQRLSATREDADNLLTLLCSIRAESLVFVQTAVEQSHGDVRKWGR
jgi:hypothetical protein